MAEAAKRAWIAGLVVTLLFGIWKIVPWVTADHPVVAGSPSLGGLTSASYPALRKGRQACISPVPLLTTVRQVSVLAASTTQPVPLKFDVYAPGYRASVLVPANWPSGGATPVTAQLRQWPRRDVVGRVCVTNMGRRTITLVGTDEPRSQVAAVSTIDGKPVSDLSLTLYGNWSSMLSRIGTLIDRASTLASLPPTFIAWLLAFGLIAAPLIVVLALALSFGESSANDSDDSRS